MPPTTPTRKPQIPFRKSEDYLTARAANPITGLISPSQYSPGLGPLTPRTPATPGKALALYNTPNDDTLPGTKGALSLERRNELSRGARRPGLRRLMAGLGKRGSSVNSDNPACTAQGLSCTVPEDASCSSDDELLFANPPQLYHSQGHDLDQVPALSRMKTVWRDVSTAWQERRAVAGASISNSSSEARAFDASTELAQMECAQQEPQAFKAPRKLAGSRVQLSRTKTMTLSDTWWILREMGHGIEEDDEIEAGTQAMESSYRPAAGVFDLRRLPPVILRRPSQAANQRLPPPRVACGRKSKPASKAKRFEMREDAGCPARPEEESTLVETILTLVLKASSMAMRSLSLNGLGEALPVMLNAEADGEARLRAMLALMRTGAHLLLVVYVLATVFATGRWLCSILRPALWPLITIFKIARWIISS